MKIPRRPLRILGWMLLVVVTFFFATAAIGWWREKRDVQTIRLLFAERESQIRSAITEVGDGVPLNRFEELFPNAYFDEQDQEWAVWIPTGYDENPACTNITREAEFFRLDGDIVRPVKFKGGVGGHHGDRFGPGGVWYYFWRAWYSSVEEYE